MPKSPTELSLREILERYASDRELLKIILEAKGLEDKKIASQESHMEERIKLENRKIEYEIMKQFKNHPLVQPPRVTFSDPNGKQNPNSHQNNIASVPTLSTYVPTSGGTQISPSSQQFTPITPYNNNEDSNPDSPPHLRHLSDVTSKYSPPSSRASRPRISTNNASFPYSRPEPAPLSLSIYRTNTTTTSNSIKTISGMVHRDSRNDPSKSAPVRDRREPREASSLEGGV